MRVEGFLAGGNFNACRRTVGKKLPALLVILEIGDHDLVQDLLVDGGIENRTEYFDPAVEIAGHQIGRGNIHGRFWVRQTVTGAEAVDTAVFQKATDDGFDANIFRQPRHAGPQAADTAHHEFDRHAGAGSPVECVDDVGIDQRVHFQPNGGRTAGLGMRDFLLDMLDNAGAQSQRRDRHALEPDGLRVAGHVVEHAGNVARDHRIGGEERKIGVNTRRHRMIVAGADVNVRRKRRALAANHQRKLGVGLQLKEAVHHLHAGAFEIARPADVGLFVETRFQFDHGRDRFAGFSGFGKRPYDRQISRGAIQRLLDGDDIRIAGRLMQEVDHDVEQLVGVMNDEVLLPDGRKTIAAVIADAIWITRRVRHKFKIRPVEVRELRHFVQRQYAGDFENAVVGGAQGALHESLQLGRHVRFDIEADHRTAAPALERGLKQAHQIFGFFEDFQFQVANNPERANTLDRVAGEQLADKKAGGAFDRNQPDFPALAGLRQAHETLDPVGHADQRIHCPAVLAARKLQGHGKSEIGNEREWMGRIDG